MLPDVDVSVKPVVDSAVRLKPATAAVPTPADTVHHGAALNGVPNTTAHDVDALLVTPPAMSLEPETIAPDVQVPSVGCAPACCDTDICPTTFGLGSTTCAAAGMVPSNSAAA